MPLKTTCCHITYLCRKDLQGNIIALIDNNGNTVVEYKYDAWGNHKVVDANGNEVTSSTHIGNLNPFRYRGYYYDVETGLYFLKSRYYDPEVGRFLNMDAIQYADPESVNGLNLYAYCGDNPVKNIDPYGNNFWVDVGNWFANTGNSIKNWFVDVGNSVKDFFVEDVYGIVIKPAVDWVIGIAAPAISNFFTSTVPDFFVNTIWNNGLVPAWNATGKFFTNTIPNFFVNTFWNDWIVDKTWNQFIVGTVWNKGLVPAWNWVLNNCQDLIDGISGVFSIGSGVVGILSAVGVVSIPVAGQIILGTASIGFGIYSIGRILKWW